MLYAGKNTLLDGLFIVIRKILKMISMNHEEERGFLQKQYYAKDIINGPFFNLNLSSSLLYSGGVHSMQISGH